MPGHRHGPGHHVGAGGGPGTRHRAGGAVRGGGGPPHGKNFRGGTGRPPNAGAHPRRAGRRAALGAGVHCRLHHGGGNGQRISAQGSAPPALQTPLAPLRPLRQRRGGGAGGGGGRRPGRGQKSLPHGGALGRRPGCGDRHPAAPGAHGRGHRRRDHGRSRHRPGRRGGVGLPGHGRGPVRPGSHPVCPPTP